MKLKILLTVAAIISLAPGIRLKAQNSEKDDVEHTTAFLVKLRPGTATTRAGVEDEWQFIPLASETQTRGGSTPVGNWWYLAPRATTGKTRTSSLTDTDWDAAYNLYMRKSDSSTRGADQKTPLRRRGIESDKIEFIEPDLGFFSPVAANSVFEANTAMSAEAASAQPGSPATRHWPQFPSVGAYQDDAYSQLRAAREAVEARMAETKDPPVRVAFLDTGYDPKHIACPSNINKSLSRNFVEDESNPNGVSLELQPGAAGSQSHGTGTIGILAGQPVRLEGPGGKVVLSGGAPSAEIIPMRVSTSVVHFENPVLKTRPSGTTRAILYAIRNKCDVISMSHGGLPSRALAEAVNAAYEAGIPMFFASGDYLQPPNLPIHSPRYVVFPAAFSRTMCVCGVTADYKTYGKSPNDKYDPALGAVDSWRLRGNWGPAVWMKNAIATFSPNIPWAHLPNSKSHESHENVIDLDGQGTSASTPQAAAAAALWLQYYRTDDRLKNNWRNWRKTESVYAALRTSAKRADQPGAPNYSAEFFGNGILQAKEALSKEPQELRDTDKQKEAKVGFGWMRLFRSVVGGTRAEGNSEETLRQMFGLELAQIAQRSAKVQEIMERYGGYDPDSDQVARESDFENFRKELFQAIRNDPRTSRHLKEAVNKEMGTL
jgi:hypothetical protein